MAENLNYHTNTEFFNEFGAVKDFDPQRLVELVARAGQDWADSDAAASVFEETRKSLFAEIALEYVQTGKPPSRPGESPKPMPVNQAELHALSDPRYQTHLTSMVEARKVANRCRVRYDQGRMYLELLRSLQATRRQEAAMANLS